VLLEGRLSNKALATATISFCPNVLSAVFLSSKFVHIGIGHYMPTVQELQKFGHHYMPTVQELQKFGHLVYVVGSFKALSSTYLKQILAVNFIGANVIKMVNNILTV
jgi:hypothetical protein